MKNLLIATAVVLMGAAMAKAQPAQPCSCPEGFVQSKGGVPRDAFDSGCACKVAPVPMVVHPVQATQRAPESRGHRPFTNYEGKSDSAMSREDAIVMFAGMVMLQISQGIKTIFGDKYISVDWVECSKFLEYKNDGCMPRRKERIKVSEVGIRQDLFLYNFHFALMGGHLGGLIAVLKAHEAAGGYLPGFANAATLKEALAGIQENYDDLVVVAAAQDPAKDVHDLLDIAIGSQEFFSINRSGPSIVHSVILSNEMETIAKAAAFLAYNENLASTLKGMKKAEDARRAIEAEERANRDAWGHVGNKF